MDKETLSNYGWIVICVLVMAVMIALSTPFGNYIKDAVWSTTNGLFDVSDEALDLIRPPIDYDTVIKGISHRGYNKLAPENTMPAYIKAKEMGFRYVETDVVFTSDGVPVLLHDETIDRTSDGTGNIADMTYAEVSQYDFGSYKSPEYTGTKIPTFEEFISWCKTNNMCPYVELKNTYSYTTEQIQLLVDIVSKYNMQDSTSWISFGRKILQMVVDILPTARVGLLCGNTTNPNAFINYCTSLQTGQNEVFMDASTDFVCTMSDEYIEALKTAGIPLEVYTINNSYKLQNLNPYITGVTSDTIHAGAVQYNFYDKETVKTLTTNDLSYGIGLTYIKPFALSGSSVATRVAYADFDIPVESGYIYTVEFESSLDTVQMDVQFYNEKALSNVENNTNIDTSNFFASGWQQSGYAINIPQQLNGSPLKVIRIQFRDTTSSATENYITKVTISRIEL